MKIENQPVAAGYPPEAQAFLGKLYDSVGAVDTHHKLELLRIKLGNDYNFYAAGGEVNDEMRLRALEHELLEQEGLITSQLA